MSPLARAIDLRDLTEKKWDAQLFGSKDGLATTLGWTSYHTLRSKGSAPGYPDRTLWRDRLVVAELKTEKGQPTDRQRVVLDGLARAGAEVYLWRPSDLDEIADVLSRRWTFLPGSLWVGDDELAGRAPRLGLPSASRADPGFTALWTPGSLWVGGGRADDVRASG